MMRTRPAGLVIQTATAVFLVAAQVLAAAKPSPTATPTAPAPDLEIPEAAVAQEAPSRAGFNKAEQARAAELEGLLSTELSISEVNIRVRGETAGVAFVVLLAYVRLLQKEARDDPRFARLAAEQTLTTNKKKKLEEEKARVETLKRDAVDRFKRAVSAASIEPGVGIVACAEAAAAFLKAPRKPEPTLTPTPTPVRVSPTPTATPKKSPRKKK
jgi:hypothetical protein